MIRTLWPTPSGNSTRTPALAAALAAALAFASVSKAEAPAGTLVDQATRELTYFNFDTSYRLFAEALETADEGSAAWQEAGFGLAVSAQNRTPATEAALAEAAAWYRRLTKETPDSRFAPRALLNLGRIAEVRDYGGDTIDLETAKDYYRQVFAGWPELDIADEAALRYADTFFQRFDDPEAVTEGMRFLEGWLEDRDDRPMASVAWEVVATVRHEYQQDYRGALDAFLKADALGLTEPNAAGEVYYRIASIALHRLGEAEIAAAYYRKVILEAPRSGRAFNAQIALEKMRRGYPDLAIDIPKIEMFMSNDDEPAASEGGDR